MAKGQLPPAPKPTVSVAIKCPFITPVKTPCGVSIAYEGPLPGLTDCPECGRRFLVLMDYGGPKAGEEKPAKYDEAPYYAPTGGKRA